MLAVSSDPPPRSVSIRFSGLHAIRPYPAEGPLPLSELTHGNGHVHGDLEFLIRGHRLPSIPFGPGNACLGGWVQVVGYLMTLAESDDDDVYEYEPAEQGYSRFVFRAFKTEMFISILESTMFGGPADPDWQDVGCSRIDLAVAAREFLASLKSAVISEAGAAGKDWWESCLGDTYVP